MERIKRNIEWMPAALAAVAFVGFVCAFGWEIFAYQHQVVEWAQRDLQSRADLAAANLEEPLRTQDFRKIHEFGSKCRADGYRLSVLDAHGHGRVFDTESETARESSSYRADQACGEYVVRLWIPRSQVMRPFHRALIGVGLAGLVGIAGVLLFFFVTYRQRVRIRELKRLESFRREFVADVSHEIKTPLTGILGAVDMLGELPNAGEPDRMKLLVNLIRKESKRLNALVQSILDLARLEREGRVLNCDETDVSELVRDVAERYGVTVAGASPSIVVSCDRQLVEQALCNLVENAKRHSGSTDISLSLFTLGNGVSIVVEDHGIGIPPSEVQRVFERFHRLDPSRAAETGGAGLGLAIVRRIAHLHGGEVSLSSAQPHGCRFTLTIPLGMEKRRS